MGDNKESIYHLESILGGLGNDFRSQAMQKLAMEMQKKKIGIEESRYQNQQNQSRADRLYSVYASKAADPGEQSKWLNALPHEERQILQTWYGNAIPKTSINQPQSHSMGGPPPAMEEGSFGSTITNPKEVLGLMAELNPATASTMMGLKGLKYGVNGMMNSAEAIKDEMQNRNTPIGPVNPSHMTPMLRGRLFPQNQPNQNAFRSIAAARANPAGLLGLGENQ